MDDSHETPLTKDSEADARYPAQRQREERPDLDPIALYPVATGESRGDSR